MLAPHMKGKASLSVREHSANSLVDFRSSKPAAVRQNPDTAPIEPHCKEEDTASAVAYGRHSTMPDILFKGISTDG